MKLISDDVSPVSPLDIKTLEELIEYSNEDECEILDKVDNYCIDNDFDSEDLDNMLYHENLQILA